MAAKSKAKLNLIKLVCSVCKKDGQKRFNYYTRKNKKTVERKIALQKHCSWCRKHTLHEETKK